MANGSVARSGSNGDRRDHYDRRKTVSGAIPEVYDKNNDRLNGPAAMRLPWSSPSAPTSPTSPTHGAKTLPKALGHKRAISGNLLSKLNFLRSSGEDGRPPSREPRTVSPDKEQLSPTKSIFSRKSTEDEAPSFSPTSPKAEKDGALIAVLKQSKTRKRTGSLRKTALLGGRRVISEARERKGSFSLLQRPPALALKQVPQQSYTEQEQEPADAQPDPFHDDEEPLNHAETDNRSLSAGRDFTYDNAAASSSSESGWSEPAAVSQARLSLLTERHKQPVSPGPRTLTNELGSPLDFKSPTSRTSNASTSDDDVLTFDRPAKILPSQSGSSFNAAMSSASTSYFPSPSEAASLKERRHSSKRSPLSRTMPMSAYPEQEPHDYTETEYWGWVILFVTWLTFTVGMGSCLEIWSWAWDVGETPYAPPELEDDPTLPIVGYYPALMVLIGVVAWVWITVAWVGMKYFRHAKIEV